MASLEPYPSANRGYDYQSSRQSGVANEYLPPHEFRSGPSFADSSIRSSPQTYLPPSQPSGRYLPANLNNQPNNEALQQLQPEVVDARSSNLASSGLSGSRQMSSWYPHNEEQRQRSSSSGVPTKTYGAPSGNSYSRSNAGPVTSYGTPARSYGTPSSSYGTPSRFNGAPSSSYGTPGRSNGTPGKTYEAPISSSHSFSWDTPAKSYGTPSSSYGKPGRSYGMPAATYGVPDNSASNFAGGRGGYARQHQHDDNGWNNEPAKYSFRYHVNDPPSNNDFGHEESRDGSRVEGTYFVLLPDGRRQVVNYIADEHGYRPTITYETSNDLQGSNDLRSASQNGEGPY
ncbi:hypothetical protein QAD02_017765 [Eretmocerus hayati]|uniref:Uncharacterized protein n=1 Tax=Eretmocerus hayati TaxID=131215 RepID=A0ACC2PFZ9_9HYME|nr:hypothetical protein QAD02_017765 [Eretmocerus hayati]